MPANGYNTVIMRRWIAFASLFLIACQLVSLAGNRLGPAASPPPAASATVTRESPTSATSSATLLPTAPPILAPPATAASILSENTTFRLRLHPDGPIYVGDQVSFEVIAPTGADLQGRSAQVQLSVPPGLLNAQAGFGRYGIGGRLQANLVWAWDTSHLAAGLYSLTISIRPDGPVWSETVTLLPRGQLPPPEPQARWTKASTTCCTVYYITGTSSERDLPDLLKMVDDQAERASQRMGIRLSEPIQIVWLPRLLGHGGFATQEIAISYLDRNYIAGDEATILHHEIIHILDSRLGGDLRPSALVEGVAVYLSGGHFKPEPILPRAAALLPPTPGCVRSGGAPNAKACGIGGYIPLKRLIDHFYFEQHEIGYLEAAALIEFMVNIWGWRAFSAFYRDIHPQKIPHVGTSTDVQTSASDLAQSEAVEGALKRHFGLNLAQLDGRFQTALRDQPLSPHQAEDLRLSISFYDTARRYQLLLDPSAHFLTAWLMDSGQMRQREIVADYLRRPILPEALTVETMLVAAGESLLQADYAAVEQILQSVNAVLDLYPGQGVQAFNASPLAGDYLKLVQAALAAGYQPHRIRLEGNTARIWVSTSGPGLSELSFIRDQENWSLSSLSSLPFSLSPFHLGTGMPNAFLGKPNAFLGKPNAFLGKPNAFMGNSIARRSAH